MTHLVQQQERRGTRHVGAVTSAHTSLASARPPAPGPHAAQRDGVELCGLWPDVLLLQGENGYLWTVAFSVSHPPPELSR